MALQYNYFTSQTDFSREPRIRVYESYPSRERRAEDRTRYPSVYKLFNNRPSLGDGSTGAHYMSPAPVITHLKGNPEAVDNNNTYHRNFQPNPEGWAKNPDAAESVNYNDTRRASHRPITPRPRAEIQSHVHPEKPYTKTTVPSQHHVVAHPKAYPKTVESVQHVDADFLAASQRPRSPQPHAGIQTHVPREMGKVIGNKSLAPDRASHRADPQPHVGIQTRVPREKGKYVGQEEKVGGDDKKREGDVGEEECVNAAAAGFIEWKRRTLQMCKNFKD